MNGVLRKLGDRALQRLVPVTTAQAEVGYYKFCYCNGPFYYARLCPFGSGACSGCRRIGEC